MEPLKMWNPEQSYLSFMDTSMLKKTEFLYHTQVHLWPKVSQNCLNGATGSSLKCATKFDCLTIVKSHKKCPG